MLEALDVLLWLRTGHRAAEFLQCTQSTISRKSRRCLDAFQVDIRRQSGEFQLIGDQDLINMERLVHQSLRWKTSSHLRLDAQHWSTHLVNGCRLGRWSCGNLNYFEYDRPLELLLKGVIDAWITSAPDAMHLARCNPDLHAFPIATMTLWPVVKHGHPLLAKGRLIEFADLADYPITPLPEDAFPVFQETLKAFSLWPSPQRDQRVKQAAWNDHHPFDDVVIGFSNTLRLASGQDGDFLPLPLPLPSPVGDVVLVRSPFCDHPDFMQLVRVLTDQAAELAQRVPDWMEPMPPLLIHHQQHEFTLV